jgi:hypothetical protein
MDDESCHQATGLVTKKKTLGASERNEQERASWREQVKELDAKQLVVLDECGSNIALTPLYARARNPDNGPEAAYRATAARTPHSWPRYLLRAWVPR